VPHVWFFAGLLSLAKSKLGCKYLLILLLVLVAGCNIGQSADEKIMHKCFTDADYEIQENRIVAIDLSDSRLTDLPPEIGQLEKLQVLDLFNNDLTDLPSEIGNLSNLQHLDLQ
jgi:Leucine-rich repeat (LRR) protein